MAAPEVDVLEITMGEWKVTMEWPQGVTTGGPSRLVVEPSGDTAPVGGISSTVLRMISFQAVIDEFRKLMNTKQLADHERVARDEFERRHLLSALNNHGPASDEYLSLLSETYLNRVNSGQEKPVDHIAEELGRSLNTIKSHLWQARKRGLLVGGSAGRKGGALSPDAYKLTKPVRQAWLAELDKLREASDGDTPKSKRRTKT